MSHSITSPNYTQIPNVVFDYWMHKLSTYEFTVLLAILRIKFDFHVEDKDFTLSQLKELTRLSYKILRKHIKTLQSHKLIKGGNYVIKQ